MTGLSTRFLSISIAVIGMVSALPIGADGDPMPTPSQQTYTVTDLGIVIDDDKVDAGGKPPSYNLNTTTAGSVLDMGRWRAVLWKRDKPEFIEPKSDQESHAFSINSRGQIAGDYGMPGHPVLWSGGKRQDLGLLLGTDSGFASIISANGVILGECSRPYPKNPIIPDEIHCIFENGTVRELATFGYGGSPTAINDHGEIVGGGVVERSYPTAGDYGGTASVYHALLWSAGHNYDLGHLEDDKSSIALGINNDGLIVGVSGGKAVLWRDRRIYDLNALIPPVPSWKLTSARSIDDKGSIIVVGTQVLSRGRRLGETHWLRLTPQSAH